MCKSVEFTSFDSGLGDQFVTKSYVDEVQDLLLIDARRTFLNNTH